MPKARFTAAMFGTADDCETAFYDALARGDLDAMMTVWADEDEIVCVHPNAPRMIGAQAIREAWRQVFEQGGVPVRYSRAQVTTTLMMAAHHVIEQIVVKQDGSVGTVNEAAHGLATNVYLKTPLGWKMLIHHTSVAPGLPEMYGDERPLILH